MGNKLILKDRKYGCFSAGYNCAICNKTIIAEDFSWESNKFGLGDTDKIIKELNKLLNKKEINFCCKCGAIL